mmetsp:Transcript_80124/g.141383  ORF Transcript_80124/g.141383 Transcript_80124/m.141383 type:complete len:139 (-) Transcript_80124:91-507(-)
MASFAVIARFGLALLAVAGAASMGKEGCSTDSEENSMLAVKTHTHKDFDGYFASLKQEMLNHVNPACAAFAANVCPAISGPCAETAATCQAIIPNGAAACGPVKECTDMLPGFVKVCTKFLPNVFSENSCLLQLKQSC